MENASGDWANVQRTGTGKGMTKLAVLLLLVLGVGVLGILYVSRIAFYHDHFLYGTYFNQADCSNLTIEEASAKIKNKLDEYALTLNFRENQTATLTSANLQAQEVSPAVLEKVMEKQNANLWITRYLTKSVMAADSLSVNRDSLAKALAEVPELQKEHMRAPSDAHIDFQEGEFRIIPEDNGTTLTLDKVLDAVHTAIMNREASLDLTAVDDIYEAPSILSDNPDLIKRTGELNELTKAVITYDLPGGQKVLSRDTLATWLVKKDDGSYEKNPEVWDQHLRDFVNQLADEADTWDKDQLFNATGLGEITVHFGKRGTYGWLLDRDAEVNQLKSDVEAGIQTERAPLWKYKTTTEAPLSSNHGFGDSYVELDLSRQHLWVYNNGAVAVDMDIVSGQMSGDRYTPEGLYYIRDRKSGITLRGPSKKVPVYGDPPEAEAGENGEEGEKKDPPIVGYKTEYEWESGVQYWMPFIGNSYGLHDASWRYSFGGNIYVWNGSHGCINLPSANAKSVYDHVYAGMPVIIYYSNGYTLH